MFMKELNVSPATPFAGGVICDLDGLLVDSEPIHFEAYKAVLHEYGIELTEPMFVKGWLNPSLTGERYGMRYYLEKTGVHREEDVQKARRRKSERFIQMAKGRLHWMPGAEAFLKKVQELKIPCGIGSGVYRQEYEFMDRELGLRRYVQTIIGGDDVSENKPSPMIFNAVADHLKVPREKCWVFENSTVGLEAAINAGMRCIVVPSRMTREGSFEGATQILSSLAYVEVSKIS